MQPHEILALKLYYGDASRTHWTGHITYVDPMADAEAALRQSMKLHPISFMLA